MYDAEGRRVGKSNGTVYVVNVCGTVIDELDNGVWARTEFYAGGRHSATANAASTVFIHSDWLGTERARTNMAGVLCQTTTNQPFGDAAATTGSCTVSKPDFFTGKPRDTESNLDDFGARYLSSQWGRWISPDWSALPSGVPYSAFTNPQSLNLYAYVGNDPIDGEDADGHGVSATAIYAGGTSFDMAALQLAANELECAPTGNVAASSDTTGVSSAGGTSEANATNDSSQTTPASDPATAQQQSGSSSTSTEAQNEHHQYDLVVEQTNNLLGGATDSNGNVLNAADHLSSTCNLAGGNCQFAINHNATDPTNAEFSNALNKALGETQGDTGAHGGLTPPTHRVGFHVSLHHDNDALHVYHFNGARFPIWNAASRNRGCGCWVSVLWHTSSFCIRG